MHRRLMAIIVLIILAISPVLAVSSAGHTAETTQIIFKEHTLYAVSGHSVQKIAEHVVDVKWYNDSATQYVIYTTNTERFEETYLLKYQGSWSAPVRVGGAYPSITVHGSSILITSSLNGTLFVYFVHNGTVVKQHIGMPIVSVSAGYLGSNIYVVWRENREIYVSYFHNETFTAPVKVADEQYPVRHIFANGTRISLIEEGLHTWKNITYGTVNYRHWRIVAEKNVPKQAGTRALGSIFPTNQAEWTFMVYMDADNSLDPNSYSDIAEMESGFNASAAGKVNVIVLWDKSGNGDTKLVSVHSGGYTNITASASSWLRPEMDMAAPQTLIDFVNWTEKNYPAKHYFLDLWDHGGDYKGAMYDETSGDIMNLTELHTAAVGILRATGRPVDIWGYDACLMDAGADNYQIKEAANIIVASEHTEGADGWNYQTVLENLTSAPYQNATEFAYNFVNVVDPSHQSIVTMVAINVSAWDYFFMPAYNGLAQALRQNAGTYNNEIRNAMGNAATADSQYWPEGKDVGDFAKNLYLNVNASSVQYWALRVLDNASRSVINYFDYDTNGRKLIMAESDSTYQVSQHPSARIFQDYEWDEMLNQVYLNGTDDKDSAPTCTITSSTPASLPQNSHLIINGTASDSDSTVERVEMKIDRGNWVPISGTTAWSVNISLLNFSVGEHYIFFRSYDGNLYSNVSYVKIHVMLRTDLPDLKFVSVNFSTTEPYEGMNISINITITNDGNNSSYNVPVSIYLDHLSPNAQILTYNYGNLSIAEEKWHVFVWNTSGHVGYHKIYVGIDPNGSIEELNEKNNVFESNLTVLGYGLALNTSVNSTYIHSGQQASYMVQITNIGTYIDTYNISQNSTLAWSVNISCEQITLAPNQSASFFVNVSVPANITNDTTLHTYVTGVSQNNTTKKYTLLLTTYVIPRVLFVYVGQYPQYFEDALNSIGINYDVWNQSSRGAIDYNVLARYDAVIFSSSDASADIMSPQEQESMIEYLNHGGRLYLSSQDLLYSLAPVSSGTYSIIINTFVNEYLHVRGYTNDVDYGSISGVAGDMIGNAFTTIPLNYPFTNYADTLDVEENAYSVFAYNNSPVAVRYANSTYRVVFTAFSFEAVANANMSTGTRLLKDIVDWLMNDTYTVPPAPEKLSATPGAGYVNLTWNAPTGNITWYVIYRNNVIIAKVPASRLWYNDTNVEVGMTYTYRITALNDVGESDFSNAVSATPYQPVPELSPLMVIALLALAFIVKKR